MQDLQTLAALDLPITLLLSLALVVLVFLIGKRVPKWVEEFVSAFREMTLALERQSKVTEANSELMQETRGIHEEMHARMDAQTREMEALRKAIQVLETHSERERTYGKEQMRLLKQLYFKMTGEEYVDKKRNAL